MKKRKVVLGSILAISGLSLVLLIINPFMLYGIVAKYKSTDHFLILDTDSRIHYEESAKAHAVEISKTLSENIQWVENIIQHPFKYPPEIFITSTQDAFQSFVFLADETTPGAAFWGKIFLSPEAARWHSPRKLMTHELTHHLFYQYRGETVDIPLWFNEGIALFVRNGGGAFTQRRSNFQLMTPVVKDAYLSGDLDYWFESSRVYARFIASWKKLNTNIAYHASMMLVHFLHDRDPQKFQELIKRLLQGGKFDQVYFDIYSEIPETLFEEFAHYLLNE